MAIAQPTTLAAEMPAAIRATYEEARRLSGKIVFDGKLSAPLATETFAVVNPANMVEVARMPACAQADVDRAVASARKAYRDWSRMPARERGRLVARCADRLEAKHDELARVLALETGNAFTTQAKPEIAGAIDLMRLYAGLAGELKGKTVPATVDTIHFTTCDPLGVVAAVIPWNAPVYLWAAKMAPALVAGNTIVMKSASPAPLAVLMATEIVAELLPPGVFNILSGSGRACGEPLVKHADVDKVTFTGSCGVGQDIMAFAARKLVPVTLELGGKSPNIILPDADLDLAIPGVVNGMRFTRQGQSCTAGSRVFIHADVYDKVVAGAVDLARKLKIGDPLDERTQVGTVVNQEQFDTVMSYVELARQTPGAKILCGGKRPSDPALKDGLFIEPTLIEGIPNEHKVCQEEIFGPVANVFRWTDFDDVMRQANDTMFGLAAAIWTRDLARAMDFVKDMHAGFVQVNQYEMPRPNVAYGGLKLSGVGKELSAEAMINHFTCSKTVIINRGTPSAAAGVYATS